VKALILSILTCVLVTDSTDAQPPLSVDTSFRTEIEWRAVGDIEFLPDGKILVSGDLKFPDELNVLRLARLNPDGTRDASFPLSGAAGGQISPWSTYYYTGNGTGLRRVFQDGSVDVPYNNPLPYVNSQGGRFHVNPDGTVLLTGRRDLRDTVNFQVYQYNACLTKLDINGQLDTGFVHRSCSTGYAWGILQAPDGKFLLSGSMDYYDGQPVGHIFRIWPDGSLDTTFHTNIYYGSAADYYFYPDGRILAVGMMSTTEIPNDTIQVLRLFPDGSVDASWPTIQFQGMFFWPDLVNVIGIHELEPDKLLLTGYFTHMNGEEVGGIAVIDTTGSIIQQYFTGTGCDTLVSPPNIITREVYRAETAPDGSLYIYGAYTGFDDGNGIYSDQRLITKFFPLNVGVEEPIISTKAAIMVYPNPGSDLVQVSWPSDWGQMDVTFHDATGRTILRQHDQTSPARLECADLSAGYYSIMLAQRGQQRGAVSWVKQD